VFEIATEILKLSRAGLVSRKCLDAGGQDETRYLEPIEDRLQRGTTPAQELLDKYSTVWNGSVDPIYAEEAY
jgi:glutamate--cysteine ligase